MQRKEFLQRAFFEHQVRFGFQPQQDQYLLHLLEQAIVFGQHRLCDELSINLSPFIADMFRPQDKLLACHQDSRKGVVSKREQELALADEARRLRTTPLEIKHDVWAWRD